MQADRQCTAGTSPPTTASHALMAPVQSRIRLSMTITATAPMGRMSQVPLPARVVESGSTARTRDMYLDQ
jgi:hypothetical protein